MNCSLDARRSFLLVALLFSCVVFAPPAGGHAQESTNNALDATALGINLYKQGNDKEAIEALQRAVKQRNYDVFAWHYLGLSLARQGKPNDARKAHEKAARLGENLLDNMIDSGPYEDFVGILGRYSSLPRHAADSAEKYLSLSSKPSKSKVEEWNDRKAITSEWPYIHGCQGGAEIRFVRAMVDNKPDSQLIQLEYNFKLY